MIGGGEWGKDEEPKETEEDNYEAEPQKEPSVKRGEIYQLGRHRLMCGDSVDAGDAKKLMNGARSEMLFTSPPYSDLRDYDGAELSVDYISDFIPVFEPYTDKQIVNLGIRTQNSEIDEYWNKYIEKARACGYKLMAWNVWDKCGEVSIGMQMQLFPLYHEWVFVFGKDMFEINRTVPKKEDNITNKHIATRQRGKDGTIKNSDGGDRSHSLKKMGSVLRWGAEKSADEITRKHPARFPVEFPAEYIKAVTNKGDIVIEPFGGSGTTMIACEQLDRTCYMMEISPMYCDIIIDRFEQYTGQKAIKIE